MITIKLVVVKSWWRWQVYRVEAMPSNSYELGYFAGDREWLASFRYQRHADSFVQMLNGAS
jgi:hypothetical protein